MKWMRSAEMEYVSLILHEDAAHTCVQQLGDLGMIEFHDLNPDITPFQRRYVSYVRRCDELDRKLRFFEHELAKFSIKPKSIGSVKAFVEELAATRAKDAKASLSELDAIELTIDEKFQELNQLNTMHERLIREYNERKELQEILARMEEFFEVELPESTRASMARTSRNSSRNSMNSFVNVETPNPVPVGKPLGEEALRFRSITGVVPSSERLKFERMVFRTTRGNSFMRFSPIEEPLIDPVSSEPVEKEAFVIFFQSQFLENKLRKICDAFQARLYSIPPADDPSTIAKLVASTKSDIQQSAQILRRNRERCVLLCFAIAERLETWECIVLEEKSTYHTLNMFRTDVSGMLRAEGWVVKDALDKVREVVADAHRAEDNKVMPSFVENVSTPWPEPPTYYEVNKFTSAFQDFVETYGVARYREINPAVFTAATFPFLFGVMFGDIGHGFLIFLFGLFMVLTEKKLERGEVTGMAASIYGGRYMIMMMGLCSVYAGFMYNDFFAISLDIFGGKFSYPSCQQDKNFEGDCEAHYHIDGVNTNVTIASVGDGKNVYPFGMDPIWKTADNELLFMNSFKMKISVIFGVAQMVMGIFLKGANALLFHEMDVFFMEFIPQLIFSCALFVYMDILIIYKWCIDWNHRMNLPKCPYNYEAPETGCQPPSLIDTMINIALQPTSVKDPLYPNQLKTQQVLLILAVISIPWMLVLKPFYLKMKHNKEQKPAGSTEPKENQSDAYEMLPEDEDIEAKGEPAAKSGGHGHGDGEEFSFGEVFIHQAIETIEFVLGMVSNTASYLRLWALSLAHTELATVFWEKAMHSFLKPDMGQFVGLFIGYAVFFAVTFGVILAMDFMECFLHALRLHWVEFQNKFYHADGHSFRPFCFRSLITELKTEE